MPYFKDKTNALHFLDDVSFAHLLPEGCVEITDKEAAQLQAPPAPTVAEIIASYTDTIQKRLDDFARTRNYDGILSAATYATSTLPKFKVEGQYAVEIRDSTWDKVYEILGYVENGDRQMPSIDELIAELPVYEWPALAVS